MAVTIRELAKLAGVSAATVSLVLNNKDAGRFREEVRRRILDLAERHQYRSNPAARGLTEGRTYRIGVCIEGPLREHAIIGEFSLYERLAWLAEELQQAGYAIEVIQAPSSQSPTETSRNLSRRAVDGFVFLGWRPESVRNLMFSLKEKNIPAVASGTQLTDREYNWTEVDRKNAVTRGTHRLLKEGYRTVVLLDIDVSQWHRKEKTAAFIEVMKRHAGDDCGSLVLVPEETSLEGVMALTHRALQQYPAARAFLLTDNFLAEAVLVALRGRGLSPGKDCRVIGFGDMALAARCPPPLSHYDLRIAQQVRFGVDALITEIRDPKTFTPRCRLFKAAYIVGAT